MTGRKKESREVVISCTYGIKISARYAPANPDGLKEKRYGGYNNALLGYQRLNDVVYY
jgi:hypothetical protein